MQPSNSVNATSAYRFQKRGSAGGTEEPSIKKVKFTLGKKKSAIINKNALAEASRKERSLITQNTKNLAGIINDIIKKIQASPKIQEIIQLSSKMIHQKLLPQISSSQKHNDTAIVNCLMEVVYYHDKDNKEGVFDFVQKDFKYLKEQKKDNASSNNIMIKILIEEKKYPEALTLCEESLLDKNKNDKETLLFKIKILTIQKKFKETCSLYQQVLSMVDESFNGDYLSPVIFSLLSENKFIQAKELYTVYQESTKSKNINVSALDKLVMTLSEYLKEKKSPPSADEKISLGIIVCSIFCKLTADVHSTSSKSEAEINVLLILKKLNLHQEILQLTNALIEKNQKIGFNVCCRLIFLLGKHTNFDATYKAYKYFFAKETNGVNRLKIVLNMLPVAWKNNQHNVLCELYELYELYEKYTKKDKEHCFVLSCMIDSYLKNKEINKAKALFEAKKELITFVMRENAGGDANWEQMIFEKNDCCLQKIDYHGMYHGRTMLLSLEKDPDTLLQYYPSIRLIVGRQSHTIKNDKSSNLLLRKALEIFIQAINYPSEEKEKLIEELYKYGFITLSQKIVSRYEEGLNFKVQNILDEVNILNEVNIETQF